MYSQILMIAMDKWIVQWRKRIHNVSVIFGREEEINKFREVAMKQ